LEDFRSQLDRLKRVGLLGAGMAGLPGVSGPTAAGADAERSLRRVRGMIDAMTRKERGRPDVIDGPRRRRIAAGAGVPPQEVERFLGEFRRVRRLMKRMAQRGLPGEGGSRDAKP
jgi:signal recognition particle subunit SRP54